MFLPTILNYLNDRERAPLLFCRILAPPPPIVCVHDSKILYYLNDRLRDVIIFVGFWRPPPNAPSSLDATILNYLSDSERGRHYLL